MRGGRTALAPLSGSSSGSEDGLSSLVRLAARSGSVPVLRRAPTCAPLLCPVPKSQQHSKKGCCPAPPAPCPQEACEDEEAQQAEEAEEQALAAWRMIEPYLLK